MHRTAREMNGMHSEYNYLLLRAPYVASSVEISHQHARRASRSTDAQSLHRPEVPESRPCVRRQHSERCLTMAGFLATRTAHIHEAPQLVYLITIC